MPENLRPFHELVTINHGLEPVGADETIGFPVDLSIPRRAGRNRGGKIQVTITLSQALDKRGLPRTGRR